MSSRLTSIKGASKETGIPVHTLRTLMAQRKIRYLKTGSRSVFLDPVAILEDLKKFEVKAVA